MKKTVLVTGGAQGIGAAIAGLLAGRGYQVAVADIRKSDFFFVRTDVSREAAVRACIRADRCVSHGKARGAAPAPRALQYVS